MPRLHQWAYRAKDSYYCSSWCFMAGQDSWWLFSQQALVVFNNDGLSHYSWQCLYLMSREVSGDSPEKYCLIPLCRFSTLRLSFLYSMCPSILNWSQLELVVLQAVAPSFKGCDSFHSFTVRSVTNSVKLFCIFVMVLFSLIKLVDERISEGGRLGQAPCWGSISTAGILLKSDPPQSFLCSFPYKIQRTC